MPRQHGRSSVVHVAVVKVHVDDHDQVNANGWSPTGPRAMKIQARFITSAATPEQFPPPRLPELAVVGRSNVGKSSLINALVGSELARTSRTPGRTRLVNWFEVSAGKPFHLVDLPGYGYAEVSHAMRESWRPLIESYLSGRTTLAGVLLLVDIRRGPEDEELDFVPWLAERGIPIIVALTKADKLAKNKRMLEIARARRALGLTRDPFAVSTLSSEGVDGLWRAVVKLVP
jgi:GTP-binding protein